MSSQLNLVLMDRKRSCSRFDWINIERGRNRVGKIRTLIEGKTMTIFSINIFPEYERRGYARKIIDSFKASFHRIVADRVRYTAVEFWLKMGFINAGEGRYVYEKKR